MPTSIRRPRALSRKAARLAASSAIALSVAAGATLATAPTASALDSTHCTKNITNQWRTVRDLAGAAVRSGPGQTYTKRYGLDMGKHFWAVCQATSSAGNTWYFGKDAGNRKGWIVASKTGKGKY
ncbi:hypothetical protein AB0D68_33495 [Streptomyces sp. NPDC048212]|uniref:hypothetical protein n=1 Tax=unclassified Streptomyces TaxID=2593676 RepID=UPI002E7698EE|nr:hypothetical protein [Streptomyces sp. JV181]MEE1774894.1 hypothetical protein [Streptomyces sp. JV181]